MVWYLGGKFLDMLEDRRLKILSDLRIDRDEMVDDRRQFHAHSSVRDFQVRIETLRIDAVDSFDC